MKHTRKQMQQCQRHGKKTEHTNDDTETSGKKRVQNALEVLEGKRGHEEKVTKRDKSYNTSL